MFLNWIFFVKIKLMIIYKLIFDIEEYVMVDCFGVGEKKVKFEVIFVLFKF